MAIEGDLTKPLLCDNMTQKKHRQTLKATKYLICPHRGPSRHDLGICRASAPRLPSDGRQARSACPKLILTCNRSRFRADTLQQIVRFHNTRHEVLRTVERCLSWENIKNIVSYPDSEEYLQQGKHGGKLKRFRKTVDGKTLLVIAEVKGEECWVVTAVYEN